LYGKADKKIHLQTDPKEAKVLEKECLNYELNDQVDYIQVVLHILDALEMNSDRYSRKHANIYRYKGYLTLYKETQGKLIIKEQTHYRTKEIFSLPFTDLHFQDKKELLNARYIELHEETSSYRKQIHDIKMHLQKIDHKKYLRLKEALEGVRESMDMKGANGSGKERRMKMEEIMRNKDVLSANV
jgi:hypothetical protein